MTKLQKFLVYCWNDTSKLAIRQWGALKMVSGNKNVVDLAYDALPAHTLSYREVYAFTEEDAIKYAKEGTPGE